MIHFKVAELERRLANILRLGTIAETDYINKQVRVQSGELRTGWIPWPAEIGRNFRQWRPLRQGTQVILASPSGDPAQALIIGMLYTTDISTPSDDPAIDLIEFDNGTTLRHDSERNALEIQCPGDISITGGKSIEIEAGTSLTLKAPIHLVQGPVTQAGGDMTSDGISAQHHTHGGVLRGPDNTAGPE